MNTQLQTLTVQKRTYLTRALVVAISLVAVVLIAQQKPESANSEDAVKKAVLETNAKMTQAANSMDIDAFFTYIADTDKCVIIQNGTVFKTRQEAIQAVKRGYEGVAKVDRRFDSPQVTVISPDVALLASGGSVSATLTNGSSMDVRFAVSMIFVHREGQWKVLHGHYSTPQKM